LRCRPSGARKQKLIKELLAALVQADGGAGEASVMVLEDRLRRIPGITVANIRILAAHLSNLAGNPEEPLEAADLEAMIFCFDKSEGQVADRLIDACPACCDAVPLPGEALEADCEGLGKGQAPEEAPGVGWYIPDADPYSFWISIVLPYWPQRFQNANFRKFFEETLRREAPAHLGLRICWLDPKQMFDFERRYRAWLEAFSGSEACNLQAAHSDLIDILFGMTTVYPPARLQGGECGAGGNEPGGILLDFSQLG
jgi:hypothetical protein